jgi:hypothetical protein
MIAYAVAFVLGISIGACAGLLFAPERKDDYCGEYCDTYLVD